MLRLAADHGFGALVTLDQGFEHQQNVTELPIPVVIMIADRTRLQELQLLVPQVIVLLARDLERRIYRVTA